MKQRVVSIILTLSIVLSLLPASARAADGTTTDPSEAVAMVLDSDSGSGEPQPTYYTDLQEAINNANPGQIVRLSDNEKGDIEVPSIVVDRAITLDLNGRTITLYDPDGKDGTLLVTSQLPAAAVIQNGAIVQKAGGSKNAVQVGDEGHSPFAVFRDVTIEGVNGIIVCGKSSNITVDGDCKITASGFGITTNGRLDTSAWVEVTNGVITGGEQACGIYLSSGTLNVIGGTVTGGAGIVVRGGTLHMRGGTVKGTGGTGGITVGDVEYPVPAAGIAVDRQSAENNHSNSVDITGGKVFSANAKSVTYTVDGTDKELEADDQILLSGGTFQAPEGTKDGSVEKYIAEDHGMDAVGNIVPSGGYKVTFHANGGKFAPGDKEIEERQTQKDGTLPGLPEPTYKSHDFDGWFTEPKDGTRTLTNEPYEFVADTQVYAHWTELYEIKFDARGGTLVPGDETAETDRNGKLSKLPTPTPPTGPRGFYFDGWYTITEKGEEKVVANETVFTKNTTVFAKWTPIYKVIFHANGGVFKNNSETLEKLTNENRQVSIPEEKPTFAKHDFDGWFTSEEGSERFNAIYQFSADTTIYAHWTELYEIKFDARGGTLVPGDETAETDRNGKLSKLPTPASPTGPRGFYFDGWYFITEKGEEKVVANETVFTKNTTVFAKWTPIYKVIFHANGGVFKSNSETLEKLTNENRRVSIPEEKPTFAKHEFDGWFTSKEGSDQFNAVYQFSADATIYAHWTRLYTVTFNPNGGSLAPDDSVATTDRNGKLSGLKKLPVPDERTGYFFDGWYTKKTGGTRITLDSKFTEDTIVYAHWIKRYSITFDANGGMFGTGDAAQPKVVELTDEKGKVSAPKENPTRENHYFGGWFTKPTGGEPFNDAYTFTEDTTIFAHWTRRYTITFAPNGGTLNGPKTATTDQNGRLPNLPPDPTRDGYTFEGWYTVTEEGEEKVIENRTVFTQDTIVYARWIKNDNPNDSQTYTITFNPNGGNLSGKRTATTDTNGRLSQSQLPTPTRDGYTFEGWFTTAEGGTKITTSTVFTQNTTVFAHWKSTAQTEAGSYTVTFDPNGGSLTGSKTAVTGTNGKLAQLPTPTRDGYTFEGWFTAAEDGTKITTDTVFTKDTTVFAHWTLTPTGDYLISLSANPAEGGSVTGGGYYDKGKSVTVKATPAKGYRFAYWIENGVVISTSATYTFTATMNRTLTAEFRKSGDDDDSLISSAYRVNVSAASNGDTTVTRRSARAGDKVIITAVPDDGYTTGSVSVTDRKGDSVFVRNNGNGTYTFTMPASQVTVDVTYAGTSAPAPSTAASGKSNRTGSASGMLFNDVSSGNWFYPSVQYVYANGLMTGDGSTTVFNPAGTTTRAMVWTVLGRMSDADVNGGGPPWYTKARSWAMMHNISDGANPTSGISRQEFMTMLWRYMGSPSAKADLNQFSDRSAVAGWADGAMQWAVSTGLILGENGRLNPTADAKRSEVAAIFMRFCETIRV